MKKESRKKQTAPFQSPEDKTIYLFTNWWKTNTKAKKTYEKV